MALSGLGLLTPDEGQETGPRGCGEVRGCFKTLNPTRDARLPFRAQSVGGGLWEIP